MEQETATPVPTVAQKAKSTPIPTPTQAPALTAEQEMTATSEPTRAPASTVKPVHQARVLLEPRSLSVAGSAPVAVDIVLDGLIDLYGVEVHLTFDPDLVRVEDAVPDMPGIQISCGPAFPKGSSFVPLNRVDDEHGTIDFAVTLLNPAKPLQGRITLASFSLSALKSGTADIAFAQVLLANRDADSLPVVSEGITLDVKP